MRRSSSKKLRVKQVIDFIATRLRKKRFTFFESLISSLPRPLTILDVGGTLRFWECMQFCEAEGVMITLLNKRREDIQDLPYRNFRGVAGDARDMKEFVDKQFDIVFSNSVIEHVGCYDDQWCMANEVRRVGKRYFLQTPNRHFPIEPHFVFPFFQFLPLWIRVWLISHFSLGTWERVADRRQAIEAVNSHRLLSKKELKKLFPDGIIVDERLLGLPKSFVVFAGWDVPSAKLGAVAITRE